MAGLVFGGMVGNKSVYKTAQYERLTQDPDDNEEEDDVLYKQNAKNLQGEITKLDGEDGNEIENGDGSAGSPVIKKARVLGDPEVKVLKRRQLSRFSRARVICFAVMLVLAVAMAVAIALLVPHIRGQEEVMTPEPVAITATPPAWTATLEDIGSESCIRLYDVDGDGLDDVIVGVAYSYGFLPINEEDINDICIKQGKKPPCVGLIIALRGVDGSELWRLNTKAAVIEINCGKIDVNNDGVMDCLATGRMATILAFDPVDGKVLWQGDNSALNSEWNNYNPVILPDLDLDGVDDILLPHGGDPLMPAYVLERASGRLVMISGASGALIGEPFDVPRSAETYMSPIVHEMSDGAQYIVFGSGGETISGALYMISVPDFYRYVMSWSADTPVPNTKGTYRTWDHLLHNDIGIYEIHQTVDKGIMVAPVCIEMTGDDTVDLLVTTFEGDVILFNGETFGAIWTASFAGYESYSSPAPGYYNQDDVIDFMLHWNYGSWPQYNHSLTVILDGKTGHTLWSMQSSQYEMTSDLAVRTNQKLRDAFVFKVQGRQANPSEGHLQGGDPQRGKRSASRMNYRQSYRYPASSSSQYYYDDSFQEPRVPNDPWSQRYSNYENLFDPDYININDDYTSETPPVRSLQCPDDLNNYLTEVFIMDRTVPDTPILVYSAPAQYYYYNVSSSLVTDDSAQTNDIPAMAPPTNMRAPAPNLQPGMQSSVDVGIGTGGAGREQYSRLPASGGVGSGRVGQQQQAVPMSSGSASQQLQRPAVAAPAAQTRAGQQQQKLQQTIGGRQMMTPQQQAGVSAGGGSGHMSSGGSERLEDSPGYLSYLNPNQQRPITTQQGKKGPISANNMQPMRSHNTYSGSAASRSQSGSYSQPARGQSTGGLWGVNGGGVGGEDSNTGLWNSPGSADLSSGLFSNRRKPSPPYSNTYSRKRTGVYLPRTGRKVRRAADVDKQQVDVKQPSNKVLLEKRQTDKIVKLCAVKHSTERTTNVISDVDGDNKLDLIVLSDYLAETAPGWQGEVIPRHTTIISKVNMEANLATPAMTPIHAKHHKGEMATDLDTGSAAERAKAVNVKTIIQSSEKSLSTVGLRPTDQQPWRQYMGTMGDSVYMGHHGNYHRTDGGDQAKRDASGTV